MTRLYTTIARLWCGMTRDRSTIAVATRVYNRLLEHGVEVTGTDGPILKITITI